VAGPSGVRAGGARTRRGNRAICGGGDIMG